MVLRNLAQTLTPNNDDREKNTKNRLIPDLLSLGVKHACFL